LNHDITRPNIADISSSERAPQTYRVIGGERQDVCGEVLHDGGGDDIYASPEML